MQIVRNTRGGSNHYITGYFWIYLAVCLLWPVHGRSYDTPYHRHHKTASCPTNQQSYQHLKSSTVFFCLLHSSVMISATKMNQCVLTCSGQLTGSPESWQTVHVLQSMHCHGDSRVRLAKMALYPIHEGWAVIKNFYKMLSYI